jgi:DNA-binding CsgD family transcriptional regulator
MIEQISLNSSVDNSDLSILLDAVGTLYLENHCYPVTIFKNDTKNSVNLTNFVEISCFELNGQSYAVLQVESGSIDTDLDPTDLLTERELQIAILVALGRPNKQIATQLKISEWTVSTHLRRIFTKLGVRSRAAMVYRCSSLIQQKL